MEISDKTWQFVAVAVYLGYINRSCGCDYTSVNMKEYRFLVVENEHIPQKCFL